MEKLVGKKVSSDRIKMYDYGLYVKDSVKNFTNRRIRSMFHILSLEGCEGKSI